LIKDLDGELRVSLNLKTFSTRALTRDSRRVSDPESNRQSEVHSDER